MLVCFLYGTWFVVDTYPILMNFDIEVVAA